MVEVLLLVATDVLLQASKVAAYKLEIRDNRRRHRLMMGCRDLNEDLEAVQVLAGKPQVPPQTLAHFRRYCLISGRVSVLVIGDGCSVRIGRIGGWPPEHEPTDSTGNHQAQSNAGD